MNFEGFQDLMRRIARNWYERAKVEVRLLFFKYLKYRFIYVKIFYITKSKSVPLSLILIYIPVPIPLPTLALSAD
jgi:hypothetical protein